MVRVGSAVLSALLLVSLAPGPASAGGGGRYLIGVWEPVRGWTHVRRGSPCHCGPRRAAIQYSLGQYYSAFYYRSRGGIGRGYWTTAYTTDGYAHFYMK